jgi:hypothetical protein
MSDSSHAPAVPVDTSKVTDRRKLRFESIDQVLAEVQRLAEADRAGRLGQLGNWTLGQTLGHLAAWAEYGYTGAPLHVPWLIKWIARLQKRRFLYGPMRAGVKIPRLEGGTLATDALPLDEGLARYQRVMERLQVEPPTAPSPVFGPLTHEESISLNLRHAELHLGFLVPQ